MTHIVIERAPVLWPGAKRLGQRARVFVEVTGADKNYVVEISDIVAEADVKIKPGQADLLVLQTMSFEVRTCDDDVPA